MSSVVPDAKLSNCLSFRKICGSTLNIINNLRIRKIFAKWDLKRIDEYIHDFFTHTFVFFKGQHVFLSHDRITFSPSLSRHSNLLDI